jgi:hypothetical protein
MGSAIVLTFVLTVTIQALHQAKVYELYFTIRSIMTAVEHNSMIEKCLNFFRLILTGGCNCYRLQGIVTSGTRKGFPFVKKISTWIASSAIQSIRRQRTGNLHLTPTSFTPPHSL